MSRDSRDSVTTRRGPGMRYTDDNLNQILGGRAYYLYSGDLAFVRQHLPALSPRRRVVSGEPQCRRARRAEGRFALVL